METRFNGLWTLHFSLTDKTGERDLGYGVAVIDGTGLKGGNSHFYWSGYYRPQAGRIQLDLFQMATHSGAAPASVALTLDIDDDGIIWAEIAKGLHLRGDSPTDAMHFEVSGFVGEKDTVGLPLTIRFEKR